VEAEIESLEKFQKSLPDEDREVFQELLNQCKQYASGASVLSSPAREVPLIISVLFVHYKLLLDLEKKLLKPRHRRETNPLGDGVVLDRKLAITTSSSISPVSPGISLGNG
jgi:hypothetical protein